jgi:hypothetical protein
MTITAEPLAIASVDDLDLLDDDGLEHGICVFCYPNIKPLEMFISFCEKETLLVGDILEFIPPNACPDCMRVWINNNKLCPRCGK